ncbi:MAG: DUF4145 domain-containing protein [Ignavibacteriaceae bacterium]|nr:DUF4145 domain-containing protein [Ignavibacteriaceae bacterium]
MEIIVKILGILAWPVTLLIIVFLFKKELVRMFSHLSNLKYKEFEANFSNELKSVERKVTQISLKSEGKLKISGTSDVVFVSKYEKLLEISKLSSRAGIVSAWFEIENALNKLRTDDTTNVKKPFIILDVLKDLANKRIIEESLIGLLDSLRNLRNQAVHYPDFAISQEEAERYISLALKISSELLQLKKSSS